MIAAGLPKNLWAEATRHSLADSHFTDGPLPIVPPSRSSSMVWLQNHMPSHALKKKGTPCELATKLSRICRVKEAALNPDNVQIEGEWDIPPNPTISSSPAPSSDPSCVTKVKSSTKPSPAAPIPNPAIYGHGLRRSANKTAASASEGVITYSAFMADASDLLDPSSIEIEGNWLEDIPEQAMAASEDEPTVQDALSGEKEDWSLAINVQTPN
ncbi:hypothetical protein H0H87_000487 [Tephrocybe sp. NHM501043]|nr:hypothetical protein H0H87_000487 [Tephrocybe sp. NHM501043]